MTSTPCNVLQQVRDTSTERSNGRPLGDKLPLAGYPPEVHANPTLYLVIVGKVVLTGGRKSSAINVQGVCRQISREDVELLPALQSAAQWRITERHLVRI